ncbi:MAG: inositol monophosphatase [Deltaproteobacteria bacterium]|nr:inositol monophosphatase [Deltaproteobacteria bacterium]
MKIAKSIAHRAGQYMVEMQDNVLIFYKGSPNNLVTEADVEVEKTIINTIHEIFPTHSILAEESYTEQNIFTDHLWIIDPIDGTNNYAHGIPHFCVSIAYARMGEIQVGVVYDPNRNEMFYAAKGDGAWMNEIEITASRAKEFSKLIICMGFQHDRGGVMRKTLETIETLLTNNIRDIRRFGSAALDMCWIACGRINGYFEYCLSPWDYAASSLIIKEAGANCVAHDGKPLTLEPSGVICGCPDIFDKFVGLVKWENSK